MTHFFFSLCHDLDSISFDLLFFGNILIVVFMLPCVVEVAAAFTAFTIIQPTIR